MESQGEGSKVKGFLSQIPSWVQMLVGVGGLIFGLGVMYNDVQTLKSKVGDSEEAKVQVAVMSSEISSLHVQIEQGNKTQEQTNIAVGKLTDSVTDLSVAVSRLQGKLDDTSTIKAKRK